MYFKRIFALFLLILINLTSLAQQTYYWNGSQNKQWQNATNWTPATVPAPTDIAIIPGTGVLNWPTATADIVLEKLSTEPGSQLDTRGFEITANTVILNGTTIKNSATGTAIRFSSARLYDTPTSRLNATTFETDAIFKNWNEWPRISDGNNHFTGDAEFSYSSAGYCNILFGTNNTCDGNLTVIGNDKINSFNAFTIFGGGGKILGNLIITNAIGGSLTFGGTTATTIGGLLNFTLNASNLTLKNTSNAKTGGEITLSYGNITMNNNVLKLSKFRGGVPFSTLFVSYNVLETAATTLSGKGEVVSNTFTGDDDISLYGQSMVTFNRHMGNSVFRYSDPFGQITFWDKFYKGLDIAMPEFGYATMNFDFLGSDDAILKTNNTVFQEMYLLKETGASVTLADPLHIRKKLFLGSGYIESSELAPVIFGPNSLAENTSDASHVVGPVQKIGNSVFTFPIGSGLKRSALAMTAPRLTTDTFSVNFHAEAPSAAGYNTNLKDPTLYEISTSGYWDVKRLSGTSNVSLTLEYNPQNTVLPEPESLRVAHWNGTLWQDLGNSGASALFETSATSKSEVTTFSPFAIANTDPVNPLPVVLVDLLVTPKEHAALLQWRTAEETNGSHFEIEHSSDAKSWSKIGSVIAQGANTKKYEFIHSGPTAGSNYYRLKMIDRDSKFAYSKMVQFDSDGQMVIYPSPAAGKIYVRKKSTRELTSMEIVSTAGSVVRSISGTALDEAIDVSGLPAGVYVVVLHKKNGTAERQKIVVK